uniref:Uncharacterized protein n=1 Tax=Candidatus Kentrum sp. LPFa TaxID=2126335 RepID=A0A450WPG5_9GAMM|nr:MAG: hypothetical protein BECKLPF1236B_GA0070989_11555 [Candidatus Kentron sp. LPFa]
MVFSEPPVIKGFFDDLKKGYESILALRAKIEGGGLDFAARFFRIFIFPIR